MGLVNFADDETNKRASSLLYARACVTCVALLMVAVAFAAFAEDVRPWDWRADKVWYNLPADEPQPFVCQKSTARNCSAGWTTSSDGTKCWQLVDLPMERWRSSLGRCVDLGGILAIIETEGQNEDVHRVCGDWQPCFIGLRRKGFLKTDFEWIDGSNPRYTNWHAEQPVEGSRDVAVALGYARLNALKYQAEVADLVSSVLTAVINIVAMCAGCCAFYQALVSRSSGMLMCTSLTDGGCACCCCLQVFGGIIGLATAATALTASRVFEVTLTLTQSIVLIGLCMSAMQIRGKLSQVHPLDSTQVSVQPPPPPMGTVVSGFAVHLPSGSSGPPNITGVVIGRPVVGEPVATASPALRNGSDAKELS